MTYRFSMADRTNKVLSGVYHRFKFFLPMRTAKDVSLSCTSRIRLGTPGTAGRETIGNDRKEEIKRLLANSAAMTKSLYTPNSVSLVSRLLLDHSNISAF